MMTRVAFLLSCDTFEDFFGKTFGLDRETYLAEYRNDFSWEYAAGLQEQGIEVVLYIPSLKHTGLYKTHDRFQVRFLPLDHWYRLAQPLTSKFKRFKFVTYLSELTNTQALIRSLLDGLQEDEISLLYVQEYWTNRFDFLVDRVPIPIIGAGHGGLDDLTILSHKRRSFPKAAKIICQSQSEQEKVLQLGGNAILLTNAVDTYFYHSDSNIPRSPHTILTVARLDDRQKRLTDLINALTYLDESWTLKIVGSGPDLDVLQHLADSLNLTDRVQFLGFISDKNVLRSHYQTCSVFALPSAFEAVTLAVLEAMSCGCAIVTSDIDSFRSLVVNDVTGLRVPVGEPNALAYGILQAELRRDRLGQAARNCVVQQYSKQRMIATLATIFRESTVAKPIPPLAQLVGE